MESVRASRQAIKTYTLEALGACGHNAVGAKAKNASMCSTVLPALRWASQQARKLIGYGLRKPGTKKWSLYME